MDISILNDQRILVIIRHKKTFDMEGLFQAVLEAGLKTIEITLNTPNALDFIERAVKLFGSKMCIGAGTVLSVEESKKVVDVGGCFIVSPVFDSKTVEYCVEKGIPVFPGALTPTEIYMAHQAGASMVKVFPASAFGPSYFKTIKGPMSEVKLIAVGGVHTANVNDYFAKGADAVAIGGGIIKPDWVEARDFQAIKKNITEFRDVIES